MKKGTIFISLGLLCITAALSISGKNLYENYRAGKASDAILLELEEAMEAADQGENPDGDGMPDESADLSAGEAGQSADSSGLGNSIGKNPYSQEDAERQNLGELYPERDMPAYSIGNIGYVGWISVPSLGMNLPVQSEWNYDLLTVSPARYSGSVYLDNMIIGGHSYITHFRSLRGIAPGAQVIFNDVEGFSYEYQVAYVMSLNPNQGAILSDEENKDWDLTLFTCNTGGATRCIVRCVRV